MAGNVTGYTELVNGNIPGAIWALLQELFLGNALLLLFAVVSAGLYLKTKSASLCFIIGVIMYAAFFSFLTPWGAGIAGVILVIELGAAFYGMTWGE